MLQESHVETARLREYLDNSRQGLKNLRTTYMNDPTIVARIDVILDSVSHILDASGDPHMQASSLV